MLKVIIPATVNTKTFPAAVAAGEVKFVRVRANGTTRNVPVLSGDDLAAALDVQLRLTNGQSVASIAKELHVSVATVRRYIQELELTFKVQGLNRAGIIQVFKNREL